MSSTYVLGHSEDESHRLTVQARLLAPITQRFFLAAGVGPGMRVLDVGSGMGDVALLTAELTTPEQRAAFLAQVAVESNQLQTTTENLNYTTAQRLQQVFGRTRFPSPDAAAPFLRNPEALANRVYANRNGNGDEASGDGYRYRGRGLMQTTGRENYRAAGHENDPETLEAPQGAADAAAQFWASHGLNGQTTGPLTQQQFDEVSRTVNRNDPNLQARWDAYQRALGALGGNR